MRPRVCSSCAEGDVAGDGAYMRDRRDRVLVEGHRDAMSRSGAVDAGEARGRLPAEDRSECFADLPVEAVRCSGDVAGVGRERERRVSGGHLRKRNHFQDVVVYAMVWSWVFTLTFWTSVTGRTIA